MTALRIINIVCWIVVLIYMAPAVASIFRGSSRTGDPARLACFGFALTSILFSARWLVAPADTEIWAALYVMSTVVAIYTLIAARSYGRGPRV